MSKVWRKSNVLTLVIRLQYPDEKRLEGLSKQLDWDVRKIQCWFRHRRNQDKPPTLTKFCESMWRFTFYLCIFCYGIRFLWSSPWFWDTRQCWHSYPYQPLTSGLYYYYIMELAFYWSLMFSQFTDIKRKVRTLAPLTPWFMAPSFPAATIMSLWWILCPD